MKLRYVIIASMIGSIALVAACKKQGGPDENLAQAQSLFKAIGSEMPGAAQDSNELRELGKKLYFEKALSVNDTISCNSCHRVDEKLGGVDNQPTSPGAHGERGGRNSPTSLNAGFQLAQFWDGRAADLAAQAKGPILNPIEMAMPSEKAAVEKISKIAEYPALFEKAFKGKNSITYDNISKAIAAFERTLITHDRFDDYLGGDAAALNDAEKAGLKLFMETGCASCHDGALLGGNKYMKLGAVNAYQTEDMGRYAVTKKEEDKMVFKVPMLRNIALTGPYFHDGSVATLDEAIKKMAFHQLGKELTAGQVASIKAFLGSLTDKARM